MASPVGYRTMTDSKLQVTAFALPSAASASVTSTGIDLGTTGYKPQNMAVNLDVAALNATIAPAAATAGVTYVIESSTTSAFSAVARTLVSKTIAGGASGVAATVLRTTLPEDCERYIRGKITFGGTTTDGSAVTSTLSVVV